LSTDRRVAVRPLGQQGVVRARLPGRRRLNAVLHQNVLLASERHEDASCGLGLYIANQRGFASANGSFLLRAVATPFRCELIGVCDRVELAGKA